jgi:hypothetical protein
MSEYYCPSCFSNHIEGKDNCPAFPDLDECIEKSRPLINYWMERALKAEARFLNELQLADLDEWEVEVICDTCHGKNEGQLSCCRYGIITIPLAQFIADKRDSGKIVRKEKV